MSRIAVISDIHGNAVAFDAVLEDLSRHPVERVVCLGDAVQGGPQPAETVARLRAMACPVVMGNADAWLLTGVETGHEKIPPDRMAVMQAVRDWSLSKLGPEDREFIRAFPATVSTPLGDGRALLAYHGSPGSFDDLILPSTPEEDFVRMLDSHRPSIFTGGHVHYQFVRHLGDTFHFNPGSIGVAYRHGQPDESFRLDPWAEYAVLDVEDGRWALEFRRVPFSVDEFVRVLRENGRPHPEVLLRHYGR